MADFFEKLQLVVRTNQGGERERTPDYLQTHPVTHHAHQRSAGARRAARRRSSNAFVPTGGGTDNPLLPSSLRISSAAMRGDSGQFPWARERLRVLSADTPDAAVREYEQMRRSKPLTDAQRYGLALARLQDGKPAPPRRRTRAAAGRTSRRISGSPWRWAKPKHARARSPRPMHASRA